MERVHVTAATSGARDQFLVCSGSSEPWISDDPQVALDRTEAVKGEIRRSLAVRWLCMRRGVGVQAVALGFRDTFSLWYRLPSLSFGVL